MKKSFYLQIFVFAIMVAFLGSFNAYAQDVSTGKLPQKYIDKLQGQNTWRVNADAQNNYGDMLAVNGFTFGAQTGFMEDISLPGGVISPLFAWAGATAYVSGMTYDPISGLYFMVDVGDTVWAWDGSATPPAIFDILAAPLGPNGIAFNPATGLSYLTDGLNLYTYVPGSSTAVLVGSHVSSTLMIDICFDYAGNCYGYDVATDMAYTINITNGLATALGSLGYNANFGQGMGYDYETGWIYLTAFDGTAFDGQLRVMDPETGYTNVLASVGLNQKDPFTPVSTPAPLVGPGRATAPTPINGEPSAVGVPSVTLSWTNPGGATTNEVFFGTDPNALASIHSGSLVTSVSATVDYSTTYYWYVNETSGTTTKGTLWSFTTEALILPSVPLPVHADFEDGLFPPTGWTQNGTIWFNDNTVSGYGDGTWAAVADFYSSPSGFDDLVTIEYVSTGAPNPMVTFDWAYATYPGAVDHLEIYYSTDQGTSWLLLVDMYDAAPGDDNLNPFNLSQTAPYYPPGDDEWSTRSIMLPPNTTHLSFTAVTDYGNLLWLDNIHITSELYYTSFENPPFVSQVACDDPTNWTTWSGAPCGNEDATISTNYAFSGTQTALIDYVPPRDVDLVYLAKPGTKTNGKWYMSFAAYIPAGQAGYFNAQATFTVDWGVEIYFDVGGTGRVVLDTNIPFTWQEDNWNQCLIVVDLDNPGDPGQAEFWFGAASMTQIAAWDWTRGGTIPNTLDGYDFFGGTLDDEMYMDDFRFSDLAPPIIQPAADVGTFSIDIATQVAPGSVTPMATVKNYGTDPQTFTVQMDINPGGYTDIQTVTALAPDTEQQVTFTNWTAVTGGPYVIDVCTQLTGDEDPLNDCQAQSLMVWDPDGAWTSGANYPQNNYLGSAVGYSNGAVNKLYSIAGITASGLQTECYEYDVPTDTWTQIASLPADRDRHATALVGDFVYQIGGYDNVAGVVQSTAFKYDIGLDTWTPIAPLPTTIGWNKAVGYGTNYIYHAGGYDGTNILADVYVYDVTADTWTAATPMPSGKFGGAFSIVGDQLIYVGGASDGPISDEVVVGTITAPGVISWVVATNPFPGSGKISFGNNSQLTEPMVSESVLIKGMLGDGPYPAGGMYRFDGAPWGADAIIVAGGSPTSTWVASDPNPCYIYYPGTDTWVAKENVLAPTTAASTGSVYDGSTWKLILTGGINEANVLTDTTSIFTQTLGGGSTFALNVDVADGWNMVSVPGTNPAGMTPVDWWSNVVGTVFKFSGGYVPVTTTAPTEGYWMKNNGAETYSYPAIGIVTHVSIAAAAGWNLIGGYELTVPTGTLTTTPPGLLQLPIFEYSGGYIVATNIVPGYAYWAKMSAAGAIDAPPLAKGSVDVVEYFKEDWGKIILTDAAGTSYTLYAVQGEVDLNIYELPPAPPAGMFDIRFGSGRIAEDLTSSQSIELNSVQYPLSVRVENMTLTLQDPSGVAVNASINPGEEVTINSSINKLIVLSDGLSIPIEYALEQNYPNPFNPSTTIKFSLPEATDVSLNIYNTLGEKIAQIVNSKLEAGRYSYQWDAGNIATGMYIYELRTDNFVSVKKMILLK